MTRKTVEFEDTPDSEEVQRYKERIAQARKRGGADGTPVGGAQAVEDMPNIVEAQEEARAGRELPEQERPYTPDEYRKMVESGQGVPGIGGGHPANQRVSTGEAPKPSGLSPKTKDGLEAMLQTETDGEEKTENTAEKPAEKPKSDKAFFQMLMGQPTDKLQSEDRRKAIEDRLEEIDLRHVLIGDGCTQMVPIIPDVFEPTFRQLNAREDVFSKRKTWEIVKEEAGEDTSQAYYDTVIGLVSVALSVTEINDEELPDHRDKDGDVDERVFDKKFDDLMRRPFVVLQDLWFNFTWFDDRVREKLSIESLGNG